MTDLGAILSNQIQRSHGAVEETCNLHEVVVSDGPGAVDQERQVSLGLLTYFRQIREGFRFSQYNALCLHKKIISHRVNVSRGQSVSGILTGCLIYSDSE